MFLYPALKSGVLVPLTDETHSTEDALVNVMASGSCNTIPTLLASLLLGTALSASVQAASYGAGIENSQWYLTESVFECALVHEIPGYGRAVFRHRAGENLSFYLDSATPVMRPGSGTLVVEAPAWRPGVKPTPVGAVSVAGGNRPVTLDQRRSQILLQGLLQGMRPTLTRASWFDGSPVRVQVSNINFASQFERYRSCTAGLLPVNFDQIQRSRILFASGSKRLSASDRQLLDNIATYILADSTIERVFVDGHSDRIGSRIDNRALSEQRAEVVANYLKARGVPDDLVTVRAHGDQYPVSRRAAENRRTNIRLQREGDRPELQQASGYGGGAAG